jgi:hypothetical protein
MLPKLSIMLLENIYSTGITRDDHHVKIVNMFIVQATLLYRQRFLKFEKH